MKCDLCNHEIQGKDITKITFPYKAEQLHEKYDFETLCPPCGLDLYQHLLNLKKEFEEIQKK